AAGFHTPDELAGRLRALFRPAGFGSRSFAEISRDAAAKLRQTSRVARLTEFAKKLLPIRQHLTGLVGNLLQSLDPIFSPAQTGNVGLPAAPGLDNVQTDDLSISVGVAGTQVAVYVIFRFCAEGEECVVLRCIAPHVQGRLDQSRPLVRVKW